MPRQYTPGVAAVVRAPFIARGVHYVAGDKFDYAKIGIDEANVRGLWIKELIDFVPSKVNV